tara:strand:+ start:22718 stop:23545 length:828 start_codon:yes stop_codon:yes gene_type:complete
MKIINKHLFTVLFTVLLTTPTLNASDWKWDKYGLQETSNPCAIPTPYPENDWKSNWYKAFIKTDYSSRGYNVVFLGDSITYGWNAQKKYPHGADVLKKYQKTYPNIRPFSLGVSGDKPENTLWLITEGKVLKTFPAPKVITLMIGINSLNPKKTPEQVAGGIKSIISVLRKSKPESKILLLGVLPCWGADAPVRAQIIKTNQLIAPYADNQTVFFLNFGDRILNEQGAIKPELTYDQIHLTEKGYELWAEIMWPYLDDLINTGGKGDIWKSDQVK